MTWVVQQVRAQQDFREAATRQADRLIHRLLTATPFQLAHAALQGGEARMMGRMMGGREAMPILWLGSWIWGPAQTIQPP